MTSRLPARASAVVCSLVLLTGLQGCGEPGAPQPPSLNLPQPVRNLEAARTGNTVHLSWSTSDRTTDHAPISGTIRTHICRVEGNGPCEIVTDLPLKLGQASQFDDALPTDKLQGEPQLLTYYIELLNHARKSAGRSNAAYSASGQGVPEVTSLTATVRREGVELRWNTITWPASEHAERVVRLVRLNETPAPPKQAAPANSLSLLTGSGEGSEPPMQTLEVAGADVRGRAIDRSTRFAQTYAYQAQGVEKLMLDGHTIEMVGALSKPVQIVTRDIFPPAIPEQLAAVADNSSHAIDLSWSPDGDADLAGYMVYRREDNQGDAVRISGASLLIAPAFHDAAVQPGVTYAYSVSAVDQAGNESARSEEAQETLQP